MRKNRILKEVLGVGERNEQARVWLKAHDFLNIAKVCRRINYNRGTFAKFEYGFQDLGEDALAKLEEALKPYGYIA